MSATGGTSVRERIGEDEGVPTEAEPGRLTAYYERIAGALDRLISLQDAGVADTPLPDSDKAKLDGSPPR